MKNYKKVLIGLILLSATSMIIGYILMHPVEAGLCPTPKNWQDIECKKSFSPFGWGQPLQILPIFPVFIFIILLFTPEKFFRAWRWFALVFGLFSIMLIAQAPAVGGGIISFDKEYLSWTFGVLFAIISALIILYQTFIFYRKK